MSLRFKRQRPPTPPLDSHAAVEQIMTRAGRHSGVRDAVEGLQQQVEALSEAVAVLIARMPNEDDQLAVLNAMDTTGVWVAHRER